MMSTVEFRNAQACDHDVAVGLIYSSGISAFDYGFSCENYKAADFLSFAFADGRGFFGWRNHIVAVLDDAVVGIGAFYSGVEYFRLSAELVWQVSLFYPLKWLPRVLWRMLQLKSLMPEPAKNMHYVANFAIRADMQNQKIGTALLQHQQEVAKQLGRDIFALDVSVDNPRAQTLYEGLGFKLIKRQKFIGKKGCVADTLRMEMSLHS
jgi:ribosomal protein S18 acetylase RimI-like enzyme